MTREVLARIDPEALRLNLARARSLAPGSKVVAVVKADGYGHGVEQVVAGFAAADVLAVATTQGLQAVRAAGWNGRLLLLEGFAGPEEFELVHEACAEYVVHHDSQLSLLAQRGGLAGLRPWLKLDTGMHRLGFPANQAAALREQLASLSGLEPILMTHFACADEPGSGKTQEQIARFDRATGGLDGEVSMANSAALLNFPETHRDYVRPGLMLYGISPLDAETGRDRGLRPAMTLGCRLLAINDVPAGETVGYGARFTCPEPLRIGVAGIGYGDGYPVAIPDGTPVLLNGRRAAIAGRVSMDMITIDLRGHDDAQVGDEVILWGADLPVEEVARRAGMIPYELVTGLTSRVERAAVATGG
jgi:alanine racemase